MKYKCPCCGFYTFDKRPCGNYDICEVCYWEDDLQQLKNENLEDGANRVSLKQARKNFHQFGACEEKMRPYVRKPKKDEYTGID